MIISITPDLALDEGYTYAGGLGVLEGDKFYGAAKLGLKYKVFTFLYREGYVEYDFSEEGEPIAKPQPQPTEFLKKLVKEYSLSISLKGSEVKLDVLKYSVGEAEAIFFKPTEPEWAANLPNRIYIWENDDEKFYTYALLAKASAEYLRLYVGISDINYIDLQEAYACMLPLVLKIPGKYRVIIHTAGPWGHPSFPNEFFEKEFGFRLIGKDICLTEIGLASSREAFTVSAKHFDVMTNVIPHFMEKLRYITNGVYIDRWMDKVLKTDYENNDLDINQFISIRKKIRSSFLEYCREYKDVEIGNRMIVAWCRRLAPYKRPNFIIDAIKDLPSEDFFFILSGKAHPQDIFGIEYMKLFREMHSQYENVIYIPNYDLSIAKTILKSANLLLFTPFPGWEACGTSYMKSALNGVPTLSSHDGAALELITDNVNGWFFGSDIKQFLQLNSPEANEINREDYEDFKNKLVKISSLYSDNLERYYKVSLNALTNMYSRINIKNVLMEYYPDQIRI